ncbi:MAG: PhnD/SsuA/transferrin family substrate-binding protein [Acidobacteria bacterium]|nr:PhnD/SsuA/transferrin family substrate-binding protein [Acidobacteriota bacterium]
MNAILSRRSLMPLLLGAGGAPLARTQSDVQQLRFSLSDSMIGDVNVTDARSAMVVWLKRIEQDLKVNLRYDPNIFESPARMLARLRQGQLDAIAVNILEFRHMMEWLDCDRVTVPVQKNKLQYVLLVRAESGINKLSDLRSRRLMCLDSPPTCIAPAWLSNLLRADSLGETDLFFSSIVKKTKPSQVILPVFFGQTDACLTTNSSFLTMAELNPQVSKKLIPLAISAELVTTLYAFRKGWNDRTRDFVMRALEDLRISAGGRQILNMFQCDRLVVQPGACLKSSLDVVAQWERTGGKVAGL